MAQSKLLKAVTTLRNNIDETSRLAVATDQWLAMRFPSGVPKFSSRHKEMVIKFAFLQSFLSWETFLDESFTLYLLGEKPPRGRKPVREHTPKRRKDAERLIIGGDRKYAEWTRTSDLRSRSKTFFRHHDPYDAPLRANSRTFDEMNVIRNAIAHTSAHSQESFKKLARNFFGTYPPSLTIGKFLTTSVPSTSPPQTFMQYYLSSVVNTANLIVPH